MVIETNIRVSSGLQSPQQQDIRAAVLAAYENPLNKGKTPDPFLIESIVSNVSDYLDGLLTADEHDPRMQAYIALETERTYQDMGFGNAADTDTGHGPGRPMTPGECLLTIEELVQHARKLWYRPLSAEAVQHLTRKIGGVALQSLERYGAPAREFTPAQQRAVQEVETAQDQGGNAADVLFARIFGGR